MHILVVTHYWQPHSGGIETVAYEQSRRLLKRGFKITVVTSKIPSSQPKYEYDIDFKILRVPALNLFETAISIPYPIFSPEILSFLKETVKDVDLIHAHEIFYLSSFFASYFAKKYNKPFILTQHIPNFSYQKRFLNLAKAFITYSIGKKVIDNCFRIIASSDETAKYLRKCFGMKSIVLYNGVDHKKFFPLSNEEKIALRQKFELPVDKKIAIYVGRIIKEKGVHLLLKTMKILKNEKEIFFIIAGRGKDEYKFKRFIKEKNLRNCKFFGFTKDLVSYYQLSDLAVFPFLRREGLAMVVLEAFACGVPVVTTNIKSGHTEVIEDDKNGYLVNPDPIELAEKIKEVCCNDSYRQAGKNAREIIEKELNWEVNVDKLVRIYENVLERKT